MSTYLVNGLGGTAGFGESYLDRNDDGSTSLIDIRSVFPHGINFFGTVWNGIYINNNGNITFAASQYTYTPYAITGTTSNPIIAAFFADVDTRGTPGGITPGGTSTGTNLMWYDLDPVTGTITVTWDDVGYYNSQNDKLNAFQLQLVRVGDSDFNIIFRYEDINWTTGSASGGSGGLGGTVARAGYSAADGLNYFELPQSGNQAAILNLENTSNIATPGEWLFQVRNGAPVIAVSIGDVAQAEGNGPGTTAMSFDVVLSSPTSERVQVDYYTQTGTADGSDFIPVAGTLFFEPGQTRQTVSVEILGDTTPEPNETFTVNLANPAHAVISGGSATGTIVNDDGLVINDVSVVEGTGTGTTTATFTVTLLSASTGTVTVNFATVADTATAGTDFTSTSGTLTFAPGVTTQTISVGVVRDALVESDETFHVQLSGATGAPIADATGIGTIINDDGFVINDVTVNEGTGTGTTPFVFNVNLLSALTGTATVNYQVVGVTATAGTDFVAASGTLTFTAGITQQQITVLVNKDSLFEPDETFQVVLSNATGSGIVDGTGIGTIRNDDGIIVSDARVTEGNSGTASMVFTVSLSSAASSTITVDYATAPGTATAGTDYTSTSGTLTFAAGETSKTVTVSVNGDTVPEADETLTLQLSNAVGTGIVDATGVGTIVNDDGLSIANPSNVTEGNSGTRTVPFVVTLSSASTQQVSVHYATANGTATAGSDYVATSGTLTFAPGELSKTVNVTINGDTVFEPNETFRMVLTNPVGSVLVNDSATVSILNDDVQPPPAMYVSSVSQTEGTGTGTTPFHFFVTLTRPATDTVTVHYATAAGTATSGGDFTPISGDLTFAIGETSKALIVPVIRDSLVEANETFSLVLSNLTGTATLGNTSGIGTILNDDSTISVNDISVVEGYYGTGPATFTLSLSGTSPLPVSVDFATLNGTATAPTDYLSTSGTVTFAPGETVKSVTVQVVGDMLNETTEIFGLVLSNAVNATIARAQGTATVTENGLSLVGTGGNDALMGNIRNDAIVGMGGNDILIGSVGNDTIDGGPGLDTAFYYVDSLSQCIITQPTAGSLPVTVASSLEGTDSLSSVERLHFTDTNLAFDLYGTAGQAYRLYQAAFNRTPDAAGLGYWIQAMDNGTTLDQVAAGFMASPEFQNLYGANPSNTDFINLLYNNVLHRVPAQSETDWWVGELVAGRQTRISALEGFSESNENQAALFPAISHGIAYTPYLPAVANGSAGNDLMLGNGNANTLNGLAGNDVLIGLVGNGS